MNITLSGDPKLLPVELTLALTQGAKMLIVAETIKKSTAWFEGLVDGVNKTCDPIKSTNVFTSWKEAGEITRYSIDSLVTLSRRNRYDIVLVDKSLDPLDISVCQSYVKPASQGGVFITWRM